MAKKNSGTETAIFRLKAGVDVPEKFDGAEIRFRLVAPTDDPQEAMDRMLALTDGNVQAVLDTFNRQAAALSQQKGIKKFITDNQDASVEDIQKFADQQVLEAIKRGRGARGGSGGAKAKAKRLDEVENRAEQARANLEALKDSDPAAYEAQRSLMESLGLL